MSTASKEVKPHKPLPPPNSDFYQLAETLPPEDLATLKQVRSFMENKVAPIINKYWIEDSFPFELLPAFKDLNLGIITCLNINQSFLNTTTYGISWIS